MKMNVTVAFCLCVFATLTPMASATSVPVKAPDPGRGIIGVKIKVIPPVKIGGNFADAVYFVRVVADTDPFGAESFIQSNYSMGSNVYLLNAEPGRYVAIGCKFTNKPAPAGVGMPVAPGFSVGLSIAPGPGMVVFSKADILQTEVEVRAGAVVFMGEIKAQSSTKTRESDEAQAHYLRMISPAATDQGSMARALSGNLVYTAVFKSIVRGEAAETEFWSEATKEQFKNEPGWTNRIAGRSVAPVGGPAIRTSAGATGATSPIATNGTLPSDDFLSGVCVDVNTAKARANGQPEEAEKIARLVCQPVMTDWDSRGCRENSDQDQCKKRLSSLDVSLKSWGSSMLFAAAQAGRTSICSIMIAMGSDPNAAISTGWTPLMIAAAQNRPETVKLLLEKGANPNARNAEGKTPIAIAGEYPYPEINEMLAKAAAEAPVLPKN